VGRQKPEMGQQLLKKEGFFDQTCQNKGIFSSKKVTRFLEGTSQVFKTILRVTSKKKFESPCSKVNGEHK
jgi:hypothetical protein